MSKLPVTGETEITQPENRLYYPALDGLRAIAFLMVFFWHYLQLPWGWSGVDMFFVMSGFLITGILYDSRQSPHRVRSFYVRRTLRIFPLYYGVLLALAITAPLFHWGWEWFWVVWPLYLGNFLSLVPLPHNSSAEFAAAFWLQGHLHVHTLTLNLGHFWSLCVEEQFYLIWPWIVFMVRDRRRLVWICALSLPVCLALRVAGLHLLSPVVVKQGALAHFTLFRMDSLLCGGLLALLLRGPNRAAVMRAFRRLLPAIAAATLTLFVASSRVRNGAVPLACVYTISFTLLCLAYMVLIGYTIQPTLFSRFLSTPVLRWAGRISYGAYVFHDIFHNTIAHMAAHLPFRASWSTAMLGLTVTYSLAWLSFRFFEAPFLNLKNRWAPAMPSRTFNEA